MPAAVCNLYIEQGATYSRTIILTNPNTPANCTTNAIGYAVGSTSILVTMTSGNSIIAGDYVSFGTENRQYLVEGIVGAEPPYALKLTTGIETAIPAAATAVKAFKPTNLTGYNARAQVRQYPKSTTSAAVFTCAIDDDPALGKIVITLTAAQTALIPTNGAAYSTFAAYNWDLEIEDSTGVVTRLLNGSVSVSPESTK